jgi:acyl-CoA hydrolase
MVALDENDRPTTVPGLIIESDEEKNEYSAALLRKERRLMCK